MNLKKINFLHTTLYPVTYFGEVSSMSGHPPTYCKSETNFIRFDDILTTRFELYVLSLQFFGNIKKLFEFKKEFFYL